MSGVQTTDVVPVGGRRQSEWKNNAVPRHYHLQHLSVCDGFDGGGGRIKNSSCCECACCNSLYFTTWYQTHGVEHTHTHTNKHRHAAGEI